jgi:hypothetical protein
VVPLVPSTTDAAGYRDLPRPLNKRFLDQPVVDPGRGTGPSLAPRSEQLLISAANGSDGLPQVTKRQDLSCGCGESTFSDGSDDGRHPEESPRQQGGVR